MGLDSTQGTIASTKSFSLEMAKKQLKASGQYSSELWDMLEKQVTTQLDKIDTDKLGVMMFKKLDANGDGKVPSLF